MKTRKEQTDPESDTIKKSLQDLNFQVSGVRTAKVYETFFDASSKKEAESVARLMCTRLLVNPTKDEYKIEVEPVGNATRP